MDSNSGGYSTCFVHGEDISVQISLKDDGYDHTRMTVSCLAPDKEVSAKLSEVFAVRMPWLRTIAPYIAYDHILKELYTAELLGRKKGEAALRKGMAALGKAIEESKDVIEIPDLARCKAMSPDELEEMVTIINDIFVSDKDDIRTMLEQIMFAQLRALGFEKTVEILEQKR